MAANPAYNTNPFYSITAECDSWGHGKPQYKTQSANRLAEFFDSSFWKYYAFFKPVPNQAICLSVFNDVSVGHSFDEDAINNFTINFVVNPNFQAAGGQNTASLNFQNVIDPNDINNLVNQLDFNKFANYQSVDDLNAQVNLLLTDIQNLINQFPQMQLAASNYIDNQIASLQSQSQSAQAQLDNLPNMTPAQAATVDVSSLNDTIKSTTTDINYLHTFVDSGGSSYAADTADKILLRYNSFSENFTSIIDQVYNDLVTNGVVNPDTSRTASNAAIPKKTAKKATEPGVGIDPQNTVQAAAVNQVLAQNQIISFINVSGTNLFGPHQPYDQVMSILDVMRNESAAISHTSDLNVKDPTSSGSATGNSTSACEEILDHFSPSEIKAMVAALEEQAANNITHALTNAITTLKRSSITPKAATIAALTGFTGVDFSKVNLADPSTIDFTKTLANINKSITTIQNLTLADISGPYGLMILRATQFISNPQLVVYAAAFNHSSSIDFTAVFNRVDQSKLAQCLSISQIKNWIQNPLSIVSNDFNKSKIILIDTLKLYQIQVLKAQAIVQNIVFLQSQIKSLNKFLSGPRTKIQVVSPLGGISAGGKL